MRLRLLVSIVLGWCLATGAGTADPQATPAPGIVVLNDRVIDAVTLSEGAKLSPYAHSVASASDGSIHIVWAPYALPLSGQSAGTAAGHIIRMGTDWRKDAAWLPGDGVTAIESAGTEQGGVAVTWCRYAFTDAHVLASEWSGAGWTPPLEVTDRRARASCFLPHTLSVRGGGDGSLHYFWPDYRESILLRKLVTGEGDLLKVYTRRVIGGKAGRVARIPEKGPSTGRDFSTFLDAQKRTHVVWAETNVVGGTGPATRIMHARFDNGRWGTPEPVRLVSPDDREVRVSGLAAGSGPGEAAVIAWILCGWKDQKYVCRLERVTKHLDKWSEPVPISDSAESVLMLSRGVGDPVLLYQECARSSSMDCEDPLHVPIRVLKGSGSSAGQSVLLRDSAIRGSMSAALSDDGHLHLTVVTVAEHPEAQLRYLEVAIP